MDPANASEIPEFNANPELEAVSRQTSAPSGGETGVTASCRTSEEASKRAAAAEELPVVPGYELLEVLGRGGMGVVYKARDVQLNRLVALKMILAGEHAGPEDRVRFFSEAEAVARLQHPNIVQIYEVGRQGDLPYFALEYVEGGTLSQALRNQSLSPEDAARIVERLARAIHYAHQRDVVHRDLKPANILLKESGTRGQEPEAWSQGVDSWIPMITDFGLAKRLEGGHGLTQTGQVLGTPAYMAPEQASGRTKEIGPLSDVYALGVILYEMLTGKPPFRAASFLETLEQVLHADPQPPSRVRAGVPNHLEVICLKALAKEPAHRYSSALAMAQDLERFLAGESIVAQREGQARKLWRKIRRRPTLVGLSLLAIVTLVVAGVLALSGLGNRRLASLHGQIEARLDADAWTAAESQNTLNDHLKVTEELVDELNDLAPEVAANQRQRLHQRLTEWIQSMIRRPTMPPEQMARIEQAFELLATREPTAVGALREAYKERLLSWEKVFELNSPFANLKEILDPAVVKSDEGVIQTVPGAASSKTPPEIHVVSRVLCQGNVEIEAILDPSWRHAQEFGVWLNTQPIGEVPKRSGYGFLVRAEPFVSELVSKNSAKKPRSQPPTARTGAFLCLMRDETRLIEREVKIPAGPLRIRARREGDRLTFQVNDLPALVFQEVFPLTASNSGYFGLSLPLNVNLKSLSANRQALPLAPSTLERGDDFFARNLFADALAAYRQQAIESGPTSAVGREARYKEALCLLALHRRADMLPLLERLANEDDKRWTPLSLCQLWLFHLQDQRSEEAEKIFSRLSAQYNFTELATLLPEDDRERILKQYSLLGWNVNLYKPDLNRIPALERAVEAEKFLRGPGASPSKSMWNLFRAYAVLGRTQDAVRMAESQILSVDPDNFSAYYGDIRTHWVEEFCWLMRVSGDDNRALKELDRWLFAKPGVYRSGNAHLALLHERARIHASRQDWAAADKDIEDYFRLVPAGQRNFTHASSCLLRGFIRENLGDPAGAMQAWKDGYRLRKNTGFGLEWIYNLVLGSLTNEMTDAHAEQYWHDLLYAMSGNDDVKTFANLVRIPPATLRDMWRSPRGRDYARKFASRSVSMEEHVRVPPMLLATEAMRQGAFTKPTTEQDEVMWDMVNLVGKAYFEKKFQFTQIVLAGSTWKGNANFLGWGSFSSQLDPTIRAPAAYVFGHRYLRLNRPADAVNFFRTALADAPPDSVLAKLARTDLDRLRAK